jgi:diguanylate cyclase (GGDEF)-like protein
LITAENQLSEVLSDFARTMLTDFPIQGILDQLVRRIVEILPITGAGVTLISETTNPHYVAASDESAMRYEELQTVLDEGPCIAAYRTGKPVTIADLGKEKRFPVFINQARDAGLAAAFTFPLHHGASRLGALDLYRDTPGDLDEEATKVAQTLADVASAYLVNAQGRSDLLNSAAHARATSLHDGLTGLPNRVLLLERIQHALISRRRSGKLVAVLFIDLDGFKQVNDSSGHQAGDELLMAVSSRLTNVLRPGDTLARLSGDEFVMVCEGLEEEGQIEGLATRLDVAIATPFDLSGSVVALSASIGIAFAGLDSDPERLLHSADTAMYQVKRKGGAHHEVLDKDKRGHRGESLQRDLSQAVQRRELRLEYQPIVRLTDGRVTSLEALLRWDHRDRGLIPPSVLIPLAEQSGDITEIGRWVLEHACNAQQRWVVQSGTESFPMAVNISAHQLMASGFLAMVETTLDLIGTDPKDICLEITAGAFVQDGERALTVLSQLKELGVQVALDGFEYSSMTYLMEFPFDVVKFDATCIANITESKANHAIVAKTIELAHLLDLVVVCEGVETAEQNRKVTALGADSCQGFYLSPPMTAQMVDDLVDSFPPAWVIPNHSQGSEIAGYGSDAK